MKTLKGYVVLKETELFTIKRDEYKEGVVDGESESQDRVESLEKGIKRKDKEIKTLREEVGELEASCRRSVNRLEDTIAIYEEERDDTREVAKQSIDNLDQKALLDSMKEALDRKTARLKDREQAVVQEEAAEYKKGYADGVADGVRKISEITQEDRNQAMKVAMVAAASHSTPEVIKELTRGTNQLTSGNADEQDSES